MRLLRFPSRFALSCALVVVASCHGKSSTTTAGKPVDMAPEVVTVPGKPGTPPPVVGTTPVDPDALPVPLDPEITRGTLPNGLTYYVMKHGKPEQRASLWLAVNTGSVMEDDDQRGLAHFCEHMAFNGTKRFPKSEIVDFIERTGMQFGADLNAYTSFDETVYQLTVPTDDAKAMQKGLEILRDWAGDVSYDPVEVEKERGVVLEEWRLGRGAWARLFDKQLPILFEGAKYAQRDVIGLADTLRTAPRDTLYRFYKDWYQPQNMAVIAVGDFDPAAMQAAIEKQFGDLQGTKGARVHAPVKVPVDQPLRVSIETDKEMPYTQVAIMDKLAKRANASKRDYRRFVVEGLYQRMLNARFAELAEDPDAPFTYAGASLGSWVRDVDTFDRSAQAKEGRVEETLTALARELHRIEAHGFLQSELDRAERAAIAETEREVAEWSKVQDRDLVAEIVRNFLGHEQMPGRPAELAMMKAMLPTITLAELDQLAKTWGTGERGRVVTVSGPDKSAKTLPDAARVKELLAQAQTAPVDAWKDDGADGKLLAAPPVAGKVVKTGHDDATDATTWTLANGVRVIVKPTTYQNDEVLMFGSQRGGSSRVADKDWANARFAAQIANSSGAGVLGPTALRKAMAGKVASVWVNLNELTESAYVSTRPADLGFALELLHARLTAPRKDARAFARWKADEHEQLRNKLLSPEQTFFEQMEAVSTSNHPRYAPATDAMVEQVDLDKALAIYKDRFADLGDMTFTIVGNVDLAKLRPLVETYLGSLPSKGRKETWKDVGAKFPAGKVEKTWTLGTEPKSFVEIEMGGPDTWSREAARDAHVLAMVLDIRLREVLREDMGGVYGVWVDAGVDREPKGHRHFVIEFGCDPERVGALRAAAFAAIEKIGKEGIGPDYLAKVHETLRRSRETDTKTNRWWLDQLRTAAYYGDDFRVQTDLDALLARVTSDRVKASVAHFFTPKAYVAGVMKPVAGTAKVSAPPLPNAK